LNEPEMWMIVWLSKCLKLVVLYCFGKAFEIFQCKRSVDDFYYFISSVYYV